MTSSPVPVDVVVVAYNSASSLGACLTSVIGDSTVSRVVVVDNCSADESSQVAAELGAEVVQAARNGGFGAGCNIGMRATKAPFVLLLNPDASVESGTVAGLRDALAAHPDAAAVGSVVIDHAGRPEPVRRRFPALRRAPFEPGVAARLDERWYARQAPHGGKVEWLSAACILVRRDAFLEVHGFDERFFLYSEETDLCARWRTAGWSVRWVPDLRARHEGGASTRHLPGQGKVAWVDGYLRFARTHHRHPGSLQGAITAGFVIRTVIWALLGQTERRKRYAAAARRAARGLRGA